VTNEQLAALRQLAGAASPGPWRNGADPSHFDSPEVTDDRTFAYYVTEDNDAAFIAALNPTTATALLDRIEELQISDQDRADLLALIRWFDGGGDKRKWHNAENGIAVVKRIVKGANDE
jgi:hypothetical protein